MQGSVTKGQVKATDSNQAMESVWGSEVECNMCGDVGFADQLRHCTACRVRVQHTYCCTSTEGVDSGSWICDWCRMSTQRVVRKDKRTTSDLKESTRERLSQCTLTSPDNGLEYLIKAALPSDEVLSSESLQARSCDPSPNNDSGSNCSSSLESEKLCFDMGSLSCGHGEASSNSCENRLAIDTSVSDEEGSLGTVQMQRNGAACDIKRSPNSLRCSVRGSSKAPKQKALGVKTLKTQLSLPTKQIGPPPLKRLSSLKVLSRPSSSSIGEPQPKGRVLVSGMTLVSGDGSQLLEAWTFEVSLSKNTDPGQNFVCAFVNYLRNLSRRLRVWAKGPWLMSRFGRRVDNHGQMAEKLRVTTEIDGVALIAGKLRFPTKFSRLAISRWQSLMMDKRFGGCP